MALIYIICDHILILAYIREVNVKEFIIHYYIHILNYALSFADLRFQRSESCHYYAFILCEYERQLQGNTFNPSYIHLF